MVNYLARLGWSYGDQEIFSVPELVEKFAIEDVGKSAGVFDLEKLSWVNSHYMKTLPLERLVTDVKPFLAPFQTLFSSSSTSSDMSTSTIIVTVK